ncbi:MAG: nickel pincer cofactor biosynthesis protein LarC [Pyrinomonadaceae bacterium]
MPTLYFDCFAGASGNMILAALISLGVDAAELEAELRKLNIGEFALELSQVDRSGINSLHVEIKVPHEHAHRHLSDIQKIIEASDLKQSVKERAVRIFTRLAEAEARVHGIDVGKVHFHEVGAMDAIVDIVGACIAFEMLGVERFVSSRINVGSGFVKMAHGNFPVPPPAVAELLKEAPIYSAQVEGELTTPTGAAIISTVCDEFGELPDLKVAAVGYGAGTREYKDFPNVIRLMLGEAAGTSRSGQIVETLVQIETNVDDATPQILGFVMERAFEIGALDCWFTPIQMKKNRPASMISILCDEAKADELKELLYRETTTLGVRVLRVERECLPREVVRVETSLGSVDVKIARLSGEIVNAMPEYDQVKSLARNNELSFSDARRLVLDEMNRRGLTAKA